MTARSAADDKARPRLLILTAEWFGILVVALVAGQFMAGLMSLVLSAEVVGRLVWLPTPIVVFFLLSLRVRESTGRFAWPGAAGLWWTVAGMIPIAWLGATVGSWLYPQLFGCGSDCAMAAATGTLAGASVLGLTGLVTIFVWRAAVAAGRVAVQ